MKAFRKINGIITLLVLVALIFFLLIRNRKDMQEELTAMLEYNEVVPVEIAAVRLTDFSRELTESGVFFSNSDVDVVAETQGKIVMFAFQVGDRVSAGQVLATVEKEVTGSRFKLAKENLAKAEKDLERFKNLEGGEAATRQQLEAAELARQEAMTTLTDVGKQLENTTITAPISGTVSERLIEQGTWLTSGTQVCTISDQNRMNFKIKLAGSDLQGLSTGEQISLQADVLPGHSFQGKIKNIGVTADLSGRYPLEVEVPNTGHLLRSGMTGRATFTYQVQKNKLVIPRKCIDGSLHQAHVFVLNGNTVSRREVTVQLLNTDFVEVISGLQPGEKVVTTGQINLAQGSSVKVISDNY